MLWTYCDKGCEDFSSFFFVKENWKKICAPKEKVKLQKLVKSLQQKKYLALFVWLWRFLQITTPKVAQKSSKVVQDLFCRARELFFCRNLTFSHFWADIISRQDFIPLEKTFAAIICHNDELTSSMSWLHWFQRFFLSYLQKLTKSF